MIPGKYTADNVLVGQPNVPEVAGLVVGLSVGFGVLLLIAIAVIIVLVMYGRLRNKPSEERNEQDDNGAGCSGVYEDVNYESYYSTIPDNVYSSTSPVEHAGETDPYTSLNVPTYITVLPDDEC